MIPSSSRSQRGSRRALLTGVAVATLAIGGLAQAAPALAAPAHETVSFELELGKSERSKPVPATYCPAGMHLTSDRYASNPNWNLTAGVQVIQEKPHDGLGIDIRALFNRQSERIGAGGEHSTVSNRAGAAQTLTIVLHCER